MTQPFHVFSNVPMPVLELSAQGGVTPANAPAQEWLRQSWEPEGGCSLEMLFAPQTVERLHALMTGQMAPGAALPVWLRGEVAEEIPGVGQFSARAEGGGTLFVLPMAEEVLPLSTELLERVEILSQMIGAARDACWCIDFLEPVDLRCAEEEIVDQVFRNRSRWRACNDAMAALYDVPPDQDFNTQPVSRYFPETPVNRAMIRDLVRMGYRLDGAQAIDQRHDGTPMLVENDFRALIRDGFLIRLWGTTRDIGATRAREQEISAEAEVMRDILGSVPDPIFVLSEVGIILATNPAAEQALGEVQVLGTEFDSLAASRDAFARLCAAALEDGEEETELLLRDGPQGRMPWLFRARQMPQEPRRYVVRGRRKLARRRARTEEPS